MRPLLILSCTIGLLYQVYEVSDLFFAYRTQTAVQIAMETNIVIPSFSICFRAIDFVLNRKKSGRKYPKTRDANTLPKIPVDLVMDVLGSTTVHEILREAPEPKVLMSSCRLRQSDFYSLMYYNDHTDCNKLFNVTSYVFREFVCYHVQKANVSMYNLWQVSFVPEYFNLLYSISFDIRLFYDVQFFTVYVHEPDTSMLFDSAQTRIFRRLKRDSVQTVQATYRSVTNHRLPSPYDTNCSNLAGRHKSFTELALECMNNQTIEKLGKIFFASFNWNTSTSDNGPWNRATKDILDLSFLTGRDILDPYIDSVMKEIKDKCFRTISVCEFKHTYSRLTRREDDHMMIDLMLPRDPMVTITHYPR